MNAARRARITAAASAAASAACARDGLSSTVRRKARQLAAGLLAVAMLALDGRVGLAHRPDCFKLALAFFAIILVNRHLAPY